MRVPQLVVQRLVADPGELVRLVLDRLLHVQDGRVVELREASMNSFQLALISAR
jgi:hypothetical protein